MPPLEIRSKYQKKTLEEVEYHLDEFVCHYCGKPFMADWGHFKCVELDHDNDFDWARIFCPYCGRKQYRHM